MTAGNAGKGRAPGSRNKRTEALLALAEDGETPCAFALRIVRDETKTPEVRLQAARIAAPFVHAKPQPEPRLVSFTLPEAIEGEKGLIAAHESVLRATASGELSLEDARDISAMLETHRRIVEASENEQRLARLEALQRQGA